MTNPIPQGAIWVKNYKLRQSVATFISTKDVECPECHHHFNDVLSETQEAELYDTIVNQVMTVKIKILREKFIAISNTRKVVSTHPDYFLYVYQTHTGAPAVYPFASSTSKGKVGESTNSTVANFQEISDRPANVSVGISVPRPV